MVSVSFPFHRNHFYSVKRLLSQAAGKGHGYLHLMIEIYFCFHGHLFSVFVSVFHFRFTQFALLSVSLLIYRSIWLVDLIVGGMCLETLHIDSGKLSHVYVLFFLINISLINCNFKMVCLIKHAQILQITPS